MYAYLPHAVLCHRTPNKPVTLIDLPHVKWFVMKSHAKSCLLQVVILSTQLHKSAQLLYGLSN